MSDLIGKIVDRKYRLVRLIGEGGMGAVYEAEHTVIERKVAVKVMHAEFSSSKEIIDRFFREAQASSAIGHPNIIDVEDVFVEEDGTAFIVMELLNGMTLADRMTEDTVMPPSEAVAIILQVLSALVVAHEKGIIHRDLKPDNVFLAVDNRGRQEVKLLDFGIAKVQDEQGDQGLTKTGTVLGTPNYMSPEQARGKKIDARIDIWAAGVMLYEMLSGQLPFSGESYNQVLSEILLEDPPPLSVVSEGLPDELIAIVEKAMEKDRDKRYPNVQTMMGELMPFKAGADDSMTASAAQALKTSLIPSPVNVTTARTERASPVGGVTMRELGFGTTDPGRHVHNRRMVIWPMMLVLTLGGLLGLVAYFKTPDQTFGDAARKLLDTAGAYWGSVTVTTGAPMEGAVETASLSPGDTPNLKDSAGAAADASGTSPEKQVESEDDGALETAAPGDAAGKDAIENEQIEAAEKALPKEVTVTLTGVPKKARIILDGKKISKKVTLPRSDDKLTLKITAARFKPFKTVIIPDEDKTIDVELVRKGRKGRRKKR